MSQVPSLFPKDTPKAVIDVWEKFTKLYQEFKISETDVPQIQQLRDFFAKNAQKLLAATASENKVMSLSRCVTMRERGEFDITFIFASKVQVDLHMSLAFAWIPGIGGTYGGRFKQAPHILFSETTFWEGVTQAVEGFSYGSMTTEYQ